MVGLRRKVSRFVKEVQRTPRKGFTVVTETTVRLLGVLIVGGFIFTLAGGNLTPTIRTLAQLFQFGPQYEQAAVESAKALTFAISCSAMINGPGAGEAGQWRDAWNTPFSEQNFGSRIDKKCSTASPYNKGVVKFGKGVEVRCDRMFSTQASNPGCRVYGFTLPQDIPYSGPWQLGGGGAIDVIKDALTGNGMPKYVLYYQKLDKSVSANWHTRTSGWNMLAIGLGAVTGLIPGLTSSGLAGRVTAKVGGYVTAAAAKVARVGDSAVTRIGPSVSKYVPSSAYSVADDAAAATRAARTAGAIIGRAALRPVTWPMSQAMRLGNYLARLGAKYYAGFAGRGIITREGAQRTMARFFRQLDNQYDEITVASRTDPDGNNMFRLVDNDGNVQFLNEQQFVDDVLNENMETAMRESGVWDDLASAADDTNPAQDVLDDMTADMHRKIRNTLNTMDDLSSRSAASGGYGSAMDPSAAFGYQLKKSLMADDWANTIIQRAQNNEGVSAAASDILSQGTPSARALEDQVPSLLRSGTMGAICNSKVLHSQVLQAVAGAMDSEQFDLWSNLGRCAAYSGPVQGAIEGMCSGAGVSNVRMSNSYGSLSGVGACAAMTAVGHAADFVTSTGFMHERGNVNSLYLAKAWMPPLQFKLHPYANYYFVGLNKGNGIKARFHMASPMFTDKIADASGTPHLAVRRETYGTQISGTAYAKSDNPAEGERYTGPKIEEPLTNAGICDGIESTIEGFTDAIRDWTSGIWLAGGIVSAIMPSDAYYGLKMSEDTSGYPAADVNWSGTFYKSQLCSGELVYTQYPFVMPKPEAWRFGGAPHGGSDTPPGRSLSNFFTVQYVKNPALGQTQADLMDSVFGENLHEYWRQIWVWNGGCEYHELEAEGSFDITPEVGIPFTDVTLGAGGEINYDIDAELDEIRWNCDTRSVNDIKYDYGLGWPRLSSEASGTTYFEDNAFLTEIWNGIVDFADFTRTTKTFHYPTMSVMMEGVGNNNNWRTRSGTAVYGWNADEQRNQIATTVIILGSIAVEAIVGYFTAGVGAVILAGVVGGAGGEAWLQWYKMKSAWPNH